MKNKGKHIVSTGLNRIFRREFLGLSIFSLGSAMLSPVFAEGDDVSSMLNTQKTGFIVESGQLKKEGLLFIGLLKIDVNKINALRNAITAVKQTHNYRSAISYKSTDGYKLLPAKEAIDAFFDESSAYFYVKVFKLSDFPTAVSRDFLQDWKYSRGYDQFLADRGVTTNRAFIKKEAAFGPNRFYTEKFNASPTYSYNLRSLDFHTNVLLQLTDLLVGSISAENFGFMDKPQKNAVKAELIQYLRERLNVSRLDLTNLSAHPKIQLFE
ncbi:MAG: hypothetical protein AAFN93_28650 [Bacteroidota bacterium]